MRMRLARIAEAGITLLRNDGTLPLAPRKLDSIAVIGAGADAVHHRGRLV